MRVLSPMSQDDEEEIRSQQKSGHHDEYKDDAEFTDSDNKNKSWRRTMENALVKMTAEIAALREQISTGREYQGRKRRSIGRWIAWLIWLAIRHLVTDLVLLGILLYWLRKKKDRRIEDSVRAALRVAREYVRKILPPR
jgi:pullulanase/glycogen debranching enzyme